MLPLCILFFEYCFLLVLHLLDCAQVVRGDFIIFFNQIFDALCKLSADSDTNVQSAAHLLDRLVKVNRFTFKLHNTICLPFFFYLFEPIPHVSTIITGHCH